MAFAEKDGGDLDVRNFPFGDGSLHRAIEVLRRHPKVFDQSVPVRDNLGGRRHIGVFTP